MCGQSQENKNGAKNMHHDNRRIASLTVWPFLGTQFSVFCDGNVQPTLMKELKRNLSLATYLSARKMNVVYMYLHRKRSYMYRCEL